MECVKFFLKEINLCGKLGGGAILRYACINQTIGSCIHPHWLVYDKAKKEDDMWHMKLDYMIKTRTSS